MKKDIYNLLSKRNFRFLRLMRKLTFSFFLVLFWGLFTGGMVFGQTNEIPWNVDQQIDIPFIVPAGKILIIAPGVNVEFLNPNSKIIVQGGAITAVGTANSPITFFSSNPVGSRGIELIYADSAVFEYCSFENFNPGVTNNKNNGTIYSAWTVTIKLKNCVFSDNLGGVIALNASNLLIEDCTFIGNHVMGKNRGVVYLENSSSTEILNNLFINNITNIDGVISINLNTEALIKDNSFLFNTWDNYGPVIGGYPIIYSKGESGFTNNIFINSNLFENNIDFGNSLANGSVINEVSLAGDDDMPENSFAFIWNNTFNGGITQPISQNNKTAIRARGITFTASHNSFKNFSKNAMQILYCDAKIHVNKFENNNTSDGVIYFENYSNYSGNQTIFNEVYSNTFTNNFAYNGGAIRSEIISNDKINLSITSNYFFKNVANGFNAKGGAIYSNRNGNIQIIDNTFELNQSDSLGGAICILNAQKNIIIKKNLFKENFANSHGGAISIFQPDTVIKSPVVIESNDFDLNNANECGGSLAFISDKSLENTEFKLLNNYFSHDSALINGGAVYFYEVGFLADSNTMVSNYAANGGAIYGSKILQSQLSHNIIYNNWAHNGGGIYLDSISNPGNSSTELTISDNIIQNNYYQLKGGGLYLKECYSTQLIRNLIAFNIDLNPTNDTYGNAVYVDTCDIDLINCNIMNNESASDRSEPSGAVTFFLSKDNIIKIHNCNVINHATQGGLFFEQEIQPENISIHNCLFWGNEQHSINYPLIFGIEPVAPIDANYCYFDNLSTLIDVNVNAPHIQLYPLPGWQSYNNLILECENSVCVDSGNPAPEYFDAQFPPSCQSSVNDIGITGGPFAQAVPHLYQPYIHEMIKAFFTIDIVSNQSREIQIEEASSFSDHAQAVNDCKYQWFFGDGNCSEKTFYKGSQSLKYDFENSVNEATILLILETEFGKRTYSQTVKFDDNTQEKVVEQDLGKEFKFQENQAQSNPLNDQLLIFPNPTSGQVNLTSYQFSESRFVEIVVQNLFGEVVYKNVFYDISNNSTITFFLRDYSSGMYIVTVNSDLFTTSEKILLSK